MSKLETLPAEEGAALLPQRPKSTYVRRGVAAAAVAFAIARRRRRDQLHAWRGRAGGAAALALAEPLAEPLAEL